MRPVQPMSDECFSDSLLNYQNASTYRDACDSIARDAAAIRALTLTGADCSQDQLAEIRRLARDLRSAKETYT